MELGQGLKSLVLAGFRRAERGQCLPVHRVVHQDLDLDVDGALGALGKVKVQVAEDQVEALLPDHQLLAVALDGITDPLLHQAQPGAVHCAGHWKGRKGLLALSSTDPPFSPGTLPAVLPAKRRHLPSGFLQETPGKLLERQLGGVTHGGGALEIPRIYSALRKPRAEKHTDVHLHYFPTWHLKGIRRDVHSCAFLIHTDCTIHGYVHSCAFQIHGDCTISWRFTFFCVCAEGNYYFLFFNQV